MSMKDIIEAAIEGELERGGTAATASDTVRASKSPLPAAISSSDATSIMASLLTGESVGVSFLQALPFPIVIKDREGKVVWCNREFEILADGTLGELKNMTSPEIFDLPDKNPLTEAERLVIATGKAQQSMELVSANRVRQTLRFGICDPSGAIHRIGVIAFDVTLSLHPAERVLNDQAGQPSGVQQAHDQAESLEERRRSLAL